MGSTILQIASLTMGIVWVGASGWAQDGPPIPKPTAEHERLAKEVGAWDATIKSWTHGPGSEPVVSTGVQVSRMMPGGLWLVSASKARWVDSTSTGRVRRDTTPGRGST